MATSRPCSSSSPTNRRRTAAWRDYQIDHSEPHSCAPATSGWPKIPAQAAPLSDAPDPTRSGGKLSSQADLADRFGVSVATLAKARKKGLLAGHLVGGQWRFTEQQVADYLRHTEKPLRLYGRPRNDSDLL
jgi:Helix-turn-helix domain